MIAMFVTLVNPFAEYCESRRVSLHVLKHLPLALRLATGVSDALTVVIKHAIVFGLAPEGWRAGLCFPRT